MIFTRERKNNRKNRKTISFLMLSGGKKMGPLARNGLDTITVQSGKMGKEYTELKKKKKKKDHPYNFLKLNFRAGPALPINKRFWIKFYYARTYFL